MKSYLILFLSLFNQAQAADDLRFSVPQSELSLQSAPQPQKPGPTSIGLSLSNWKPDHVTAETRLSSTTEFAGSGPRFTLDMVSPFKRSEWGLWSSKLGLSYMQLERSGFLKFETSGYQVSQTMNLYQLMFGVQWSTSEWNLVGFKPLADLALTPTWLQSSRSEFNNGISETRWATMLRAGLRYDFHLGSGVGISQTSAEVAFEKTQGFQEDNTLAGSGISAGVRMGWN